MATNTTKTKKVYAEPSLTYYGNVTDVTQQPVKPKTIGIIDDFQVPGVTNP